MSEIKMHRRREENERLRSALNALADGVDRFLYCGSSTTLQGGALFAYIQESREALRYLLEDAKRVLRG